MQKLNQQKLPSAGIERELRRVKGQFWTPDWIAEAMVEYVLANGSHTLFDPAVGEGAFFRAARTKSRETGRQIELCGTEIDPTALHQALGNGLTDEDIANVKITDFVLKPPDGPFKSIVANPPYIRHHRLSADTKTQIRALGARLVGKPLDGRAGLHIFFLLRALELLDRDGRLAFIMPADTCEGIFASTLWRWITKRFRLETVVTFDSGASPFPGVDTNPIIFMIRNANPTQHFSWIRCHRANCDDLQRWIRSPLALSVTSSLTMCQREIAEGLATGLSRPPNNQATSDPVLGDFAQVMRGIATGANEYFFLTGEQARQLQIPNDFLITAIGRTRDVVGEEITLETVDKLRAKGRPTLLLSLDDRPVEKFPIPIQKYISQGLELGFDKRPLIKQRRPWYRMETRAVPPILFAYLGRRNARFIYNRVGVLPLTGFLCVYPNSGVVSKLWQVLSHPETISNLALIGKSYGSGAIKVEPRALEKLRLPQHLLVEFGLTHPLRLLERKLGDSYH